jgi:hypothetical protein
MMPLSGHSLGQVDMCGRTTPPFSAAVYNGKAKYIVQAVHANVL